MRSRTETHLRISFCLSLAVLPSAVIGLAPSGQDSASQPASITRTGCLVDEASFARATGLARVDARASAQFVLMERDTAPARAHTYAVTGSREPELAAHTHRLVELTGELEGTLRPNESRPPASGVAIPPGTAAAPNPSGQAVPRASSAEGRTPSGAAGVTPQGNAAHEPGDATAPLPGAGGEVPPNSGSPASAPDEAIVIDDLPRLNVRTFRILGGSCGESLNRLPIAAETPAVPASAVEPPATRSVAVERATLTGCVIHDTSVTPAGDGPATGSLLLTRATRSERRPVPTTGGAVPGSPPSGAGTGTVPRAPRQPPPTDSAALDGMTFALEGRQQELAALVGERVSLEGLLRTGIAARQQPSSHSTAPAGTLIVESFRTVPGSCR